MVDHDHDISWPAPPAGWQLESDNIHVWAASVRVSPRTLTGLAATLCAAERQRAGRFHFQRDRDRFIAGRGTLRCVLGCYLRARPCAIELEYGPHGKPSLAGPFATSGLLFNLAHCEDLALLAVTRSGMIGVDVERVRTLTDADELAARFFSPRECARFRELPRSERPAAFFNIWTRKEAWLKATGDGITDSLDRVEVSFQRGEPVRLLNLPDNPVVPADRWQLHDLAPAPGFAAALAVAADCPQPRCWHWNQEEPSSVYA
ncbi:MAG TPA: 4'-phosphopantetheinyl transferase superfamily protein [Candidatus Saccharimonadales bacterium]|nr:4'-phosphopantetheinyl transferase superfamily protein [Candidatus Saccharimonadales bacterium]